MPIQYKTVCSCTYAGQVKMILYAVRRQDRIVNNDSGIILNKQRIYSIIVERNC